MIYDKEESIIRNLLTFKRATYQKVYEDSNDFAETYPFIPYQFKLLQDVFTDIRKHGYAGKHLSSGERSLLGAFQETAKRFGNSEVGTIIPFYAFYDTIEQFLEHQVKIVINTAIDTVKSGELKDIDIKVLKMLFMLKNIKEIPANIDNLSTLYVSNIKNDKISIKKEISDSLRRLEVQTLIQRNNDEYKFLTDEEQEINREIKQIIIDQNRITDYLKRIVFDYILTDSKFTYKNKNFPLTKYIDNIKYSQEYEIGIKIITTSPEKDDTDIIMQSARENKYVFIKLEISTLIYDEITNYLQVEEYRRSKSGIFQTQQVEDIIRAKQREIENAEARVKENIKEQLNAAEIIIAGDRQNINAKEARARANEALEILINNIYTKFAYIKHNFSTQDIKDLFHENKQNLLGNEVEFVNQKAYDAMKEYCEEKNAFSLPMTTRTLLQDFGAAPYGFLDEDILYILTRLIKDEVVSLIYNNEVQNITSEDTLTKILKRDYYDRTIIKIRQKIEMSLINDLKSVARNAFNVINLREDEDGMVEDFKNECLQSTLNKLNKIAGYYHISGNKYQYPGEDVKDNASTLMERLLRIRDVGEFFKEVSNSKDELTTLAPKLEMILDFFDGIQKEQFDEAKKIITIYDNNKDYADKSDELKSVVDKMISILTSNEPYSEIHELPTLRKDLMDILTNMYEVKSEPIINMINDTINYFEEETKKAEIDESFAKYYIDTCKNVIETLNTSNELKDIYAQETRIKKLEDRFINALEYEKSKKQATDEQGQVQEEKIIKRTIVRTDSLINRSYEINSKEDIDKYVEELKEKLQKLIDSGTEFLDKKLRDSDSKFCAWNASVIRFIESEYGVDSTDAQRLKNRLYHPSVYVPGADNKSLFIWCFEEDLKKTLEELRMIYNDIDENEMNATKAEKNEKTFAPTFNFNIDNSNSNVNTTNINITFEKLEKEIKEDTNIQYDEKEEIIDKLNEIKEIQQSNKNKKQKWSAIKSILIFLLDKGVDFVITYLPQILLLIKMGGING